MGDNFFESLPYQVLFLTLYFQISDVLVSDGGQYECQVSSSSKLSLRFNLIVVVPKVIM